MKTEKLLIVLKFAIVWFGFAYLSGICEHFNELPRSVHQSAQCDRASLAQNYYYGGFKFLYPEVNENRCIDGIVSCELPLTAFLAASLYKIFGYDEMWFRLLSFCFFSFGMFSLFLLLKTRLNEIAALLLILILQSSPILMFYAANFLPDISALGLGLIALFLFYRLFLPHAYLPNLNSIGLKFLFVFALSFSIATKTTNIILWLSMSGLILFSYFKGFKINIYQRSSAISSLLLTLIIPLSWQLWSKHLGQTHNFQYFMMRIPWSESWLSYKTSWLIYLANWPQQTFSEPLIFILFGLLFLPLFLKKYISNETWFLALFNLIGSLAFLFVMIEQFKYHDYYIICLFPAFILNWLAISEAISKIPSKLWWTKVVLFLSLVWAFQFQSNGGIINLRERYTPGNYWEQSHVNAQQYDTLRQMLLQKGIDRNACVLAGYDASPNNILYLLHLRGHRYSKEHGIERMDYILNGAHPQYLISNDSAIEQLAKKYVKMNQILEYNQLRVYNLIYSNQIDSAK
ncbi:MAG: glycosyltransferase family 39 protein [Bacteroidia bacterium]|nr:glycosyltransferase family 39 protein [Bacteroidia bacterium]